MTQVYDRTGYSITLLLQAASFGSAGVTVVVTVVVTDLIVLGNHHVGILGEVEVEGGLVSA